MAICIILLLQGAGGCGLPSSHPDIPRAQKGVLNLAGWDFRTNGPVALNGEWEFYWSQQLDAAAPSSSRKEAPPSSGLITVPGVWNGFLADGRPIPGLGFATYRLKVLLDRPYSHLALKCLDAATSFRLFVNGQRLASSGLPGKTPADTRPGYEPGVFVFSTPYDQLDILIHVSNFDHWQGGLWEAIELGLPDQLARKRQGHLYFQFFLFGSLLIMGLYHLGLFLLRPAERSPLYFGLLCLLISIRTMATGETYIVEYLPGLDWNLLNQSIYIGLYLVVPCFGLFLRSLIPGEISKTVVSLALLLGVLLSLLVLTTPAWFYTYTMPWFQGIMIVAMGYGLYGISRAAIRGREGAYALLIGFLILFATAVNDILYSRQVIQTGYLGPLGLFLFIFSQAVLLSMRFSTAFHTVEQQGLALRDMNLTNRQEIEERLKTEAALRESELKYRFLADSVSDTIWTVDPNTYRFTYASPSARDLLGYSIEELTAMTLRDVLDAQSLDLTRKAIGGDLEAGSGSGDHPSVSATFELEPIGKDGKRIWTETTVNVIRHPDDGRTTVIGVTRDISERKHAEEKLRATLSEKELLLQEIHHRVKNNLQVVISLLSLQSRNETDDRVLQAIQVSQNRVRAMALVHEFIYRSESLAEINVADYLNGLVNHLSGAFLGSGLAPRVNIQVPKDLTIHLAFAVPCGLILNELISNSLKYAFSGRSDGEITIAAGLESDGRIRLMVQDNGVGLPEDFNWRESGTLGLSMVAGLIEGQLQGAIELDRESGTRWTMTFRGNK